MRLSDTELSDALRPLAGWTARNGRIERSFTFPAFRDGIEFVRRVARRADEVDHHPDIDIRYTRILIGLSTHDAGGVTRKDVDLAGEIDRLAQGEARNP